LSRFVPADYTQGAKQGFSAPDASWFKGESIEYVRSLLLNKRALLYDYVEPETVRTLLEDHFAGRENRRLLIWSLLCFEWWCRTFLEGGTEGPAARVDPAKAGRAPAYA
jgi:asparagine synthase (glutamine-hydrolysing)